MTARGDARPGRLYNREGWPDGQQHEIRGYPKMANQFSIHPNGLHVAIIMDGSGRWAMSRGKPRTEGHRAGAQAVRRAIEAAPDLGVGALTLHAFSSQNWERPQAEVFGLLKIFGDFLHAETPVWVSAGVRVSVFGRRDRLPTYLLHAIRDAETATAGGDRLRLQLAIDYSAREAILAAAKGLNAEATEEEFSRALAPETESPAVDLLIRTGGELRLSDFMLWECAYAELYFTPRLWPDFGAEDLEAALREFHSRDRRFGRIPESVAV